MFNNDNQIKFRLSSPFIVQSVRSGEKHSEEKNCLTKLVSVDMAWLSTSALKRRQINIKVNYLVSGVDRYSKEEKDL